jgi:hypothetical protein
VLAASIIRTASTTATLADLYGAKTQKTVIFILAAVRT